VACIFFRYEPTKQAARPLRLTTSNFFFQLNTCGRSPDVTSSRMCRRTVVYDCCWLSPGQSFSGPSPAGLTTTFCCLTFETLPVWRATSPYLYPPGTGWSSYLVYHPALGSLFVASTGVRTSKKTCYIYTTKINWLMLFREIMDVWL
jgi:hypothetical protein